MAKKHAFISFDFDNDKVLKEFIIGQSKHEASPFDVVDHSLKEHRKRIGWTRLAGRSSDQKS